MNIRLGILGLIACAAMVSCIQDIEPAGDRDNLRTASVPLNLNVMDVEIGYGEKSAASKAEGDAGTEDNTGSVVVETKIEAFWFIEYDADGRLIGEPKYYSSPDEVMVYLPDRNSDEIYKGIIFASIDKSLENSTLFSVDNCASLETLYSLYGTRANIEQDPADTELGYLVHGCFDIPGDILMSLANPISCILKRNVARFTFNFTNSVIVNGAEIYSIQLHNVPKEYYYYPNNKPVEYVDYIIDYSDNPIKYQGSGIPGAPGASEGTEGTAPQVSHTFYIPRNMQTPAEGLVSADVKTKNAIAPAKATYIELLGYDNSGSLLSFKFYPGKNMIDNFEIEENYSYNLTIEIKSYSASDDSRIDKVKKNVLKPSNCYIINPASKGYTSSIYAIPMTQLYRYWNEFATEKITDFSALGELEAEVIWQDQTSRAISFCNAEALEISDIGKVTVDEDAEGHGYLYFRTKGDVFGNVLVGVRQKKTPENPNPPYLWSWHLWITDYNPDEQVGKDWVTGQYIYDVTGGKVHRYIDRGATELWQGIGVYAQQNIYIMDRNLGAYTTDTNAAYAKLIGLDYQYGRKDPFPKNATQLYGIGGIGTDASFEPTPGSVIVHINERAASTDDAVKSPYTFYFYRYLNSNGSSWIQSHDWLNPNPYVSGYNRPWNNPKATNYNDYKKGIFDPCPPGWTLPQSNTWQNFYLIKNASNQNANWYSWGSNYFYIATNPGKEGDPRAYYPKGGGRNGLNNLDENVSCYMWSVNPSVTTATVMFHRNQNNGFSITSDGRYRQFGFQVRCIQEYANEKYE